MQKHAHSVPVHCSTFRFEVWQEHMTSVTNNKINLKALANNFLPWIVTVACAKLHSSTAGAGTLAKLAP